MVKRKGPIGVIKLPGTHHIIAKKQVSVSRFRAFRSPALFFLAVLPVWSGWRLLIQMACFLLWARQFRVRTQSIRIALTVLLPVCIYLEMGSSFVSLGTFLCT